LQTGVNFMLETPVIYTKPQQFQSCIFSLIQETLQTSGGTPGNLDGSNYALRESGMNP